MQTKHQILADMQLDPCAGFPFETRAELAEYVEEYCALNEIEDSKLVEECAIEVFGKEW